MLYSSHVSNRCRLRRRRLFVSVFQSRRFAGSKAKSPCFPELSLRTCLNLSTTHVNMKHPALCLVELRPTLSSVLENYYFAVSETPAQLSQDTAWLTLGALSAILSSVISSRLAVQPARLASDSVSQRSCESRHYESFHPVTIDVRVGSNLFRRQDLEHNVPSDSGLQIRGRTRTISCPFTFRC